MQKATCFSAKKQVSVDPSWFTLMAICPVQQLVSVFGWCSFFSSIVRSVPHKGMECKEDTFVSHLKGHSTAAGLIPASVSSLRFPH